MTTAIHTADDLIRILRQDPEILEQVRRAILTDELLALPEKFSEMQKTQAEMQKTQAEMQKAQAEMQKAQAEMQRTQAEMLKTQAEMQRTQAEMLKTQDGILKTQAEILDRLQRVEDRVGHLVGAELERKVFRILPVRLNRIYQLRRPRILLRQGDYTPDTQQFLNDVENALDSGTITERQYERILLTDLVVRASRKGGQGAVYFAVEASGTIARRDIDRAVTSSETIHDLYQTEAIPIVAGYRIYQSDRIYAEENEVRTIILEEEEL